MVSITILMVSTPLFIILDIQLTNTQYKSYWTPSLLAMLAETILFSFYLPIVHILSTLSGPEINLIPPRLHFYDYKYDLESASERVEYRNLNGSSNPLKLTKIQPTNLFRWPPNVSIQRCPWLAILFQNCSISTIYFTLAISASPNNSSLLLQP